MRSHTVHFLTGVAIHFHDRYTVVFMVAWTNIKLPSTQHFIGLYNSHYTVTCFDNILVIFRPVCYMTRQAVRVWRNNEARSCNHCCSGKAIIITYSEFMFVALVIQHVMCMPLIVLSYLVCLTLPHFSTLFHKRRDFLGGGGIEHKLRVLIFYTYFVRNISHLKKY
jgi:hypothetical protein